MVLEMFAYIAELKKEVWVMMEMFLKLKSIYINCTATCLHNGSLTDNEVAIKFGQKYQM